MPRFEILIPKSNRVPMDSKLHIEAESWIGALKTGLERVGASGILPENLLCDIKGDNSIHVTDTRSGSVFKILELVDGAPEAAAPTPVVESTKAAEKPATPAKAEKPATPAKAEKPATPARAEKPATPARAEKPAAAPAPPAATRPGTIGRSIDFTSDSTADLLEEIFVFTDQVHNQRSVQDACYMMLDLAMSKIGTDAGSVLLADINSDILCFGAARGPKAQEVLGFTVRVGQGMVGFCAETGYGLAISDAARDPRFYRAISEKIGYPARSILCVPVLADEQVLGVLEIINKRGNDIFSERDLGIAGFIGKQLGQYLLVQRDKGS